ncbi:DUF6512 family protein [Roseburia hominis]
MNKKLMYYAIGGAIFTAAAGTCLHFAYERSGSNPLVGMFAPVNESTWEHMKMLFFPMFLYVLLGWPFFSRSVPAFFRSHLAGTITGTMFVAIIFYTYTGIIGKHYLALDIATFIISVVIAFCISYRLAVQNSRILPVALLVTLNVGLMVGFFIFTYAPPGIALFQIYAEK